MGLISKEANNIFNNLENNDIKVINEGNEKIKKHKIQGIMNRLRSGKELSFGEIEFLRKNSPNSYAKAVKAMRERKSYIRETKTYITRKEADNAYIIRTNGHMARAWSMVSCGKGDISEEVDTIKIEVAAVRDEYIKFKGSKKYKKLKDKELKKGKKSRN